MFHIIILLFFSWIFYILFIKGVFWKILVGIFAWIGIYAFLVNVFPMSEKIFISSQYCSFSWSEVIPTVIILSTLSFSDE